MELVVDRTQPGFQDVSIDLRRREVRVAQHHLNGPKIRTAFEQVRSERVPDDMGAERARQAGGRAVAFDDFPEPHAAQRAATRVDE